MKALLNKEARLATPLLTYCFLAFSLLTFCPGYPILLSAFFVCLGIFQSYQTGLTNHDLLYSVLLPVSKKDIVKSKFIFALILEGTAFIFITIITIIRMIFLNQNLVYRMNALMNANLLFLAFSLLIFSKFNYFFLKGFFRTGYRLLVPFMWFTLASLITMMIAETLHHLPGLAGLNSSTGLLIVQILSLVIALLSFILITYVSYKKAAADFEKIDF